MKVLVAGGTGVLGRRVVLLLVESGHQVSVITRSDMKSAQVEASGASPVRSSLFDVDELRQAMTDHDAVLNLATHIPPLTQAARASAWAENDRIRTEGSAALVDAALAAGVGRYVQESIAFLYADAGDRWLDEDAARADGSISFAASNDAAEASAARFTAAGGTGVVLRFGIFHGHDAGHTRSQLALTRWGFSPLPGADDAYVPFVHLDDAATAVIAALEAPAGTYNVVDDEPLTRAGIAGAWQDALGDGRIATMPALLSRLSAGAARNLGWSQRVSNRRFRDATGWAPRYPSARPALAQIVAASREPHRVRSGVAAAALLVLALGSLFVGGWALGFPASFHSSFPGLGRAWVAPDGPFNEHLVRDVGGLELGLALVALVAAGSMSRALVRAAAGAQLVFGVPHLLYHATHLAMFDTADRVGIVVSLALPVAAAVVALVAARRPARVPGGDAPPPP